jgi:hypothetical protein
MTTYVVITGNHTSTKTPVAYVEHIVYGAPEIQAVEVGSHFVALCTYGPEQETQAEYTVDRMGSFSGRTSVTEESAREKALGEFGQWVAHYAPRNV